MQFMRQHTQPAISLSVRVRADVRDQLEELAEATGRTKSYLAAEAIEIYLSTQSWQIKSIEKAVEKANSKKARFIEHKKVSDWLNSWGTENEEEPPV